MEKGNISNETQDTVKLTKLVPANRIDSDEGAIIPKEAVSLTPLKPAMIIHPSISNRPTICCYLLLPVTIIAVYFAVKYFRVRKKQ